MPRKTSAPPPATPPAAPPAATSAPGAAPVAACGCGSATDNAGSGRRAVAVDADAKDRNIKRLRRIEGQVRGLQRMVDEDRYCADILTQLSSVQEALRAVSRELMRNHLRHCATSAITSGSDSADAMYDELVELMFRHGR
jgi:CsoR family transcriptional regulator, copper-sensing transcriptional repressor